MDLATHTLEEQATAVIRATVAVADLPTWFPRTFATVVSAVERGGSRVTGPPFARYRERGDGGFDVEAGFPVSAPIAADGEVQPATLPGGPMVVAEHVGPYETMASTYAAVAGWLEAHGAVAEGPAWERYHSEPTTDPATWRTEVVQPYR